MSFPGEVLRRGFWLYIWKIQFENTPHFYVGRTGDSSSANASSPFNRIGRHLDFRENAKGNSLAKRLLESSIDPYRSSFKMLALGPFFDEVKEFEEHKTLRDYMATLEFEIARTLRESGYVVLGQHRRSTDIIEDQLNEIKKLVISFAIE